MKENLTGTLRRSIKIITVDLKTQWKSGIHFLYILISLLYILILAALPQKYRGPAASLLIFSDPAAMGLFFMGAMVLFEKNQHIHQAFFVSPVRTGEYILGKVVSIGIAAEIVAVVLFFSVNGFSVCIKQTAFMLTGTILAEIFFSLMGIIIATKSGSLNQFMLMTVPVECLGFIPPVLLQFGVLDSKWNLYPTCACWNLIRGIEGEKSGLLLMIILIIFTAAVTVHLVRDMWKKSGGARGV